MEKPSEEISEERLSYWRGAVQHESDGRAAFMTQLIDSIRATRKELATIKRAEVFATMNWATAQDRVAELEKELAAEKQFNEAAKASLSRRKDRIAELEWQLAKQMVQYRDKVAQSQRDREALTNAIPQTYGEVVQKVSVHIPCEPHEWDNRTTLENAVWALVTVATLAEQSQRDRERIGELKRLLKEQVERGLIYVSHGSWCPKFPLVEGTGECNCGAEKPFVEARAELAKEPSDVK